MTREIERKKLLNMINNHIKKNSKTMRGFTYQEFEEHNFHDLMITLKGIQGCFDMFLKAFNQYNEGK
jgi:hemerythrin